jgi:inositol hexakisphosphate/diphosphoinositol-pentakisphosphate kinase
MGETFSLMFERWDKLYRDFYSAKKETYDLSKIPDVYDCIKYDLLHNSHVSLKHGRDLFALVEAFASCYVAQEYGMEVAEKQSIGIRVSQALCAKIRADIVTVMGTDSKDTSASAGTNTPVHAGGGGSSAFGGASYGSTPSSTGHTGDDVGGAGDLNDTDIEHHGYRLDPSFAKELRIKSPATQVRTRMYFTSESHLHTLLNVLRFQCPEWRARHEGGGEHNEYDVSIEQEKFSNEILKRMGISVNERIQQRKYVFRESKMISDSSMREIDRVAEVNYLAHIVIRVFELPYVEEDSDDRFRVEISFSPGVKNSIATGELASSNSDSATRGAIGSSDSAEDDTDADGIADDGDDDGDVVQDVVYLTRHMSGVMFEDMLATCVSSVQNKASVPAAAAEATK